MGFRAESTELNREEANELKDWTQRFALAALLGFFVFVFALPVSCCGFVIGNEHAYAGVGSGGPDAILKAMALSAVLASLTGVLVWRKTRPR